MPVIPLKFEQNLNFLNRFSKIFVKIRPVEADFFHSDRRTNMGKLTVTYRNFANASKTHSEQRLSCLLLVALLQDVVAIKKTQMVINSTHAAYIFTSCTTVKATDIVCVFVCLSVCLSVYIYGKGGQ